MKYIKAKLTTEGKRVITLAEASEVKKVLSYVNGEDNDIDEPQIDTYILETIARYAAGKSGLYVTGVKIFEASASIAKNQSAHNCYSETSGCIDIWIEITAKINYDCYIEIGMYLSDAWQIAGEYTPCDVWSRTYIQIFRAK